MVAVLAVVVCRAVARGVDQLGLVSGLARGLNNSGTPGLLVGMKGVADLTGLLLVARCLMVLMDLLMVVVLLFHREFLAKLLLRCSLHILGGLVGAAKVVFRVVDRVFGICHRVGRL